MEVSSFFTMKVTLFVVDSFEDVVDVVLNCSCSIESFFCRVGGEFVVVIEVYGAWIKAIETSVVGEFVGSGCCGIVGTFSDR